MKFEYTYTHLNVADYQACKQFYHEILGFDIIYVEDAEEYVELATGQTLITIFNRQKLGDYVGSEVVNYNDSTDAGVVLSFRVPNLDEAIAYLQAKGVKMVNFPITFSQLGFISACFRDPDGNLIELQQLLS